MNIEARHGRWTAGTDADGGLVVVSPAGRRWYPSWAAEVAANGNPTRLLEMARLEPHRGRWQ